jgi:hypothetical protein
MERLSRANLSPAKSWKGNLNGPMGQSTVWRTTEIKRERSYLSQISPYFDFTSMKKQILDFKFNTIYGTYWDVLQVLLSILSCAIFVSETYEASYQAVRRYNMIEQIITQLFVVDFLLSWFVSVRTSTYFMSPMTWVDVITILPSYLIYLQNTPDLSALRFVRILRLIRILRTFRLLGGFSGVKKQMITICLLILSLTFLAAGIYNLCENDFNQFSYQCQYISKDTNYEPSCTRSYSSYDDSTCDCQKHNCHGKYLPGDNEGQPSLIKCSTIGFLESYYFTVVTICSVGYGDFSPTNQAARIIIMIYIATAFIMIPIQINKLEQLIDMNSPYRTSFQVRPQENHIILCGHVNDKQKLSRLFREFFHPNRQTDREIEINICILCPSEPNDEVKDLLSSPLFDNRVSYIIGSALNMEDLQKARGDLACAMFFLSNIEVDEEEALLDDAATVLRTLSVNNFNSNLDCYVQVLRSQERDLLKESNAELILCYDEYKTILQARNALCPGLATLVENLFHTFGSIKLSEHSSSTSSSSSSAQVSNDWLSEYSYGARMEIYYIPIDPVFFGILGYSWQLLVEAIYLEFECLLVGVCNLKEYSAHFNPRAYERKKYKTLESYFESYQLGLLLAPNNSVATTVKYALSDPLHMEIMIEKLHLEERQFMIRRAPDDDAGAGGAGAGGPPLGALLSASTRALNVGRSFRTARSVRGIDLDSLRTEDIANLRKIQFALDDEFQIQKMNTSLHSTVASESGMDSDSSEENDDDFLGYIEHVEEEESGPGNRRVGIYGSSSSAALSMSLVKSISVSSSEISTPSPASARGGGDGAALDALTQSPSPKQTNDFETNLLDSSQETSKSNTRPPRGGLVSLKSIQNMKRAASSRKMSSLKSFRNVVQKKQKVKSLKQAASLVKAVNKLNAGGGFAALVKAAAAAEPTPDNLVARPASIVTALQQTRTNKQTAKLSIFDAVKLAKLKESIQTEEQEGGTGTGVGTGTGGGEGGICEPERTIAQDLSRFQTIKEEEMKSGRHSLSTRTSSCYVTEIDKLETIPTTTEMKGTNEDHRPTSAKKLQSQNSLGGGGGGGGLLKKTLSRSQSKTLARAQSKGLIKQQLSRSDSQVGEIISSTNISPSATGNVTGNGMGTGNVTGNGMSTGSIGATLRRSTQMGFNKTRRPSIDSSLSTLAAATSIISKGRPSEEIEDASSLKNHIIVFGCMDYISIFVNEIRKKLLSDYDYRPILIIAPQEPRKWYQIRLKHSDIFFLSGTVSSAQDLILMNIRDANSLILLAHRQAISVDETSNVDSESLFLYLTIEKLIPKNIYFTVELCRPNNMGVLNSVIVRRNKIEKYSTSLQQTKNMTTIATTLYGNDAAGTGLSLKLRGSHKFRGSVDIGSMMTRLQSEKSIDEKSVVKLASRRANVFTVPDLTNVPTRSLSISSIISNNPALHSKNQVARRKIRANRKVKCSHS